MQERRVHAKDLKLTYVHALDNEKRKRTWEWLDRKKGVDIPPVVAVMHPDGGLYVYQGNLRVEHALQNRYPLQAKIICGQEDLDELFLQEEYSWFGISDFDELVEFMQIYAKYPEERGKMPEDLERKVKDRHRGWQEHCYRERARVFGWTDD